MVEKEETAPSTNAGTRRRQPANKTEKQETKEPEKTEPENETSWKEGDDCPSGLEIGCPDEDSNECKSCEEEPFNFCTKLADQKKEEKIEKKKDPPVEKEEPTTNRRRRRQG